MTEADAPDRAPLDEVMLAMDVVDTLRHRQALIERELGSEDRDRDLIARLKAIYADQGIEVSEAALATGVAALREDRFQYTPPAPGLAVTLAGWYVGRGRIAWRGAATVGVLGALGLGYQVAIEAPAERRLEQQVSALNEGVRGAVAERGELSTRIGRLRESLRATEVPEAVAAIVRSRRIEAENSLAAAEAGLASSQDLDQRPEFTLENPALREAAEAQLGRQNTLVAEARSQVDAAALALTSIRELAALPAALDASRAAALALATDGAAKGRVEELFGNGVAALARGDGTAAQRAASALDRLGELLGQEYTLRIVSAPGEQSGVWRVPERNANARNYYLIVSAVTASGERVALPVTSEENGRTEVVSQWGVRVSEAVFERVRADKADDGILQKDRVGAKRRGTLEIEYELPVQGGAITSW